MSQASYHIKTGIFSGRLHYSFVIDNRLEDYTEEAKEKISISELIKNDNATSQDVVGNMLEYLPSFMSISYDEKKSAIKPYGRYKLKELVLKKINLELDAIYFVSQLSFQSPEILERLFMLSKALERKKGIKVKLSLKKDKNFISLFATSEKAETILLMQQELVSGEKVQQSFFHHLAEHPYLIWVINKKSPFYNSSLFKRMSYNIIMLEALDNILSLEDHNLFLISSKIK